MALSENLRLARDFAWYLSAAPMSARPQLFRMKGGRIEFRTGTNNAILFGFRGTSTMSEGDAIASWRRSVERAVREATKP